MRRCDECGKRFWFWNANQYGIHQALHRAGRLAQKQLSEGEQ